MSPRRSPLFVELPLLVWLVLVWGALWGDFSVGTLVFGAALALLVTWLLPLPHVQLSGRFDPVQFAVFVVTFVWQVLKASFQVMLIAVLVGPRTRNAVVGVRLRSHSDLLLTATGHTMALIPGSLVVEVDRSRATLYFHVLHVRTPEEADSFRESVRRIEASWIRIMGTWEELENLRAERRAGAGQDGMSAVVTSPATGEHRIVGGRHEDADPADRAAPRPTSQEDQP